MQSIRQRFAIAGALAKFWTVDFSQRADQSIAVLATDLAVFVAMTVAESRLLHGISKLIAEAISSGGTRRARRTGFVIKVVLQPDLPQMTTVDGMIGVDG